MLFVSATLNAQLHTGISAGSGSDKSFVADVRFGYHSSNYLIESHEILNISPDKPCYFGARVGKIIMLGSNSFIVPVAGYYYSVFSGDKYYGEKNYSDPIQVNKFVCSLGVQFVNGRFSIEARQINDAYQVTVGLWNIFKSKN